MNTRRVLVIVPISGLSGSRLDVRRETIRALVGDRFELEVLEQGPAAIESMTDEVLAAALLLSHLRANKHRIEETFSAVVVWCAGDPGVRAARTLLRIPVLGPGEAAARLALTVADRIGVIIPLPQEAPHLRYQYRSLGIEGAVVGVEGIGIPVLGLRNDSDATCTVLRDRSRVLEAAGAEAIVLNCMGLTGFDRVLTEDLRIPVIDPVVAVFAQLAALEVAKLSFSAATYPVARDDERI